MRRLAALAAAAALAGTSACSLGEKAAITAWLTGKKQIERYTITRVPSTSFGGSDAQAVEVWVRPGSTPADVERLALGWPRVTSEYRSTLLLHADGLDFLAQTTPENEPRWRASQALRTALPQAHVALPERVGARATAASCDPWETVGTLDVAGIVRTPGVGTLTVSCTSPSPQTLTVSAATLSGPGGLAAARSRADAVQRAMPRATAWNVDAARDPIALVADSPDIPSEPSTAVLAAQRASLLVRRGKVEAMADGRVDLRPPARDALARGFEDVQAHSPIMVVVHTTPARLEELAGVAAAHPGLPWSVPTDGLLLRARGSEFAERTRQYRAITATPVRFDRVTMIDDPALERPGIEVDVSGQDAQAVARAIRAAAWRGDMRVGVRPAPSTYGVEFTSTATGRARDPRLANGGGAVAGHADLEQVVRAWDETAG